MKDDSTSDNNRFNALFAQYVRQMSKQQQLPREVEHKLLHQARKRVNSRSRF